MHRHRDSAEIQTTIAGKSDVWMGKTRFALSIIGQQFENDSQDQDDCKSRIADTKSEREIF